VPNNVVRDASNFDFAVEVLRAPTGGGTASWLQAGLPPLEPIFNANDPVTGDPVSQFPGDTRDRAVRIRNTNQAPARDATFFMFVDQTSIVVQDCTIDTVNPNTCSAANVVASSSTNWTKFVNLWTLSVDVEKVLQHEDAFVTEGQLNENDHGTFSGDPLSPNHDDSTSFGIGDKEACSGRLSELTKNSACNLGTILATGSEDDLGQPTDTRWYTFHMAEADDGTDQSAFKGWTVTFTMIFQARVPAIAQSCTIACER
jgi:hypothetical protein